MKPKQTYAQMCVYLLFFMAIFLLVPSMVQAKALIVNVSIDPPTVSVGQPTEIRVEVFSAPGTPLGNAYVIISAGGGVFLDSNKTSIEGKTDPNGVFGAPWKCDQCAASYVFDIEVMKPGFEGWKGEATVHISSQPTPSQGGQIFATANADPPNVSQSQPTLIRVEAFSQQGHPIPGAHVRISAGGGIFLDSGTTDVEGHTNPNGLYETPWKCIQCAPAYVFNVEVNKPGLQGWIGEAKVEIGGPSMPLPGGPIVVNAGVHPATVAPGQPTEIRVVALSDQGNPIPDAHVKISAGGGVFLDSSGLVIEGQTAVNGMFVTPWKCDQCAPAYVFDIEVTKPGFDKGTAKATVKISSK